MEENKKNNKKLPLVITIATMLVCCTVFTVLCAIGLIPIPTGNGKFYSVKTASAIKKSYQVEDEATLRELLLLNEELDIVVTKDIKISEPLIVKGTKTLYGDATISADISGEFRAMYMMEVQVGASLTWDGPTLDSDGSADGINVSQKAELNIKSGTIQYMRDAVYSNGTVTMTGGLIQHVSQNGIIAAFRSKVYVNGGTLYNGGAMLLNVETNGYAEINEGATFKTSRGDTIFNAGELNIYGGTICDTIARAINTEGKLHMEYKGEKKDGYIEMYNIGSIAVRMTSSDDCYISDVHAVNIGTNGVYTTDLRSNGKTVVENCIFENCAITEGNGMSVSRKVEIKDVIIRDSQGGGLNLRTYSDIKIDGLVIDGTKGNCISNYGELEMKNVKLSNVGVNNLVLYSESEVTATDCVFGQTKRTNVFLTKNTTLNLENVQIEGVKDEGLFAIQCNEGSTLNLNGDKNVISRATRVGVCLYKNATLNMEGGKICDINGTANGAAVWVREEGSTFNMRGGTICNNTTTGSSGAVFVANKATFNMTGGTITGNKAELSGGAIQVQGTMNFSGGTISNNTAGTSGGGINVGNNTKNKIYGKLNMTGGTIEKNHAVGNGGGISVSGKTTANISGGTIKNNTSDSIGNGIADNGYLTLSGKVAVNGNDVGLVSRDIILKIKGNTLSKHSASNPLVVTPHFKTKPNQYVVIECDNEAAATAMLSKYVKSGSKVYTLIQNTKKTNQIVVNVNDIDMDLNTTGAETVYVSNFKELKEAVETTKTKRNIVIGADIVMESLITVPAGSTVKIRDDGRTRTLTRKEGHTTLFFETWYGTGLVLEGTSEGKLVLDGKTSGKVTLKNVNSLVKVRGTTEITNVAFKNNGNTSATLSGAFVNNEYGSLVVEGSSFTNGVAVNGGAIYSTAEDMTVKNSTFTNNTADRGGAIYSAKTTTVVEDTTFKNNTAAGSGGAIHNASSGTITLTGTTADAIFEGNKVTGTLEKDNYGGGALCVGTGNATITGYTFKKNETKNTNGGAIELRSANTVASITDCTFDANKSANEGGAIYLQAKEATVADSTFTNNESTGQGGAIAARGKKLDITESTFGGANAGNKATGNGGAIFSGSGSNTTITSTKDAVFEGNTSSANGGAICVGSGTVELTGYTFTDNSGSNGGAIRLNGDQMSVVIADAVFENNTATEGGAIGNASQHEDGLTVKDSTFNNNTATADGGAIASRSKKTVVENTTFTNNEAAGQGGAILSHGKELSVTDSDFSNNTATGNGGAIYGGSGGTMTLTSTKDSSFTSNASSTNGGAICVGTGVLTVEGYEFIENEAVYGGAIRVNGDENVEAVITDSVFKKNIATANGGAISNASKKTYEEEGKAACTVTACEFSENTSVKHGGAIFHENGVMSVSDSTFTANSATGNGGAMYPDASSTLNVNVCKFDGNTATNNGGAIYNAGSSTTTITGDNGDFAIFANNTANTETTDKGGGAICIGSGAVSVTGYAFESNKGIKGGAIYSSAKLEIADTSFTDNESTSDGGAIYGKNGSLTLTATKDVAFTGNKATTASGGAIYMDVGTVSVTGYEFTNNSAVNGGAVRLAGSVKTAVFTGCEFTSNKADGGYGGAISNNSTSTTKDAVTITDCTFEKNSAKYGAVLHNRESDLKLVGTKAVGAEGATAIIKENTVTENGGAIYVEKGAVSVMNYAFKSNSAKYGGAIYLVDGSLSDEGSKYESNTASQQGGAIFFAKDKTSGNIKKVEFVSNSTRYAAGGAIWNGGALTVTEVNFTGNSSGTGGAAINCEGGTAAKELVANSCTFTSNTAKGNGTVALSSGSVAEFTGTGAFTSNTAGGQGAAIRLNNAKLSVTGYTFDGNTATGDGGAIYAGSGATYADAITFTGCTFTNNSTSGNGGAICSYRNLSTTNCTFNTNTATGNGGAIYIRNEKTATVTGSTFTSNSALEGGAIYVGEIFTTENAGETTTTKEPATLNVAGSTFTSNTATEGGAIKVAEAASTSFIATSVFKNNTASAYGGAICNYGWGGCTITDCQFGELNANNQAVNGNTATNNRGGAIYHAKGGKLTLVDTDNADYRALFAGNTAKDGGGAICLGSGSVTMTGYEFDSNTTAGPGGAIRLNYSSITATFTGSVFTRNTATGNGGAIYNDSTSTAADAVKFTDCTFGGVGTGENAYALGNTANSGGAIYSSRTNLTLVNDAATSTIAALFQGNKANDNGGAIYIDGGKLSATGYQFVSNNAKNYGGAICHRTNTNAVEMDILNCAFTSNSTNASHGGALYHHSKDNVEITNTDFTSNAAKGHGGAICSEGGTLTVTDCDFTSNTAGTDGGAYRIAASCKATLKNGTFASNSADGNGGAVQFNTGELTITNYVFTGNAASGKGEAINTNNRNGTNYTTLVGCTIESSDIGGSGVNYGE